MIDFGVVIGKAFVNSRYINTKFGEVHYSKTDTHVVPYIKKEMKK
ncbi:polymorphic toxin type 50 domain-containing protein [Staphylococcus epidermidis]